MSLSQVQQNAVEYVNGPCIVSAGAGSGKTRVITHKFAHLVQTHGVNPHQILCITFTNKAAEELKNRLQELTGIQNPFWVRTIHSACLQMIKPFIVELGYQDNFTITSMSKQKSIIKEIMKVNKIPNKEGMVNKLLMMISRCKDYPNPIKHLEEEYAQALPLAKLVFGRYQDILMENNFLDFDDILHHAYWLIRHSPDFKQRCIDEFRYILVDEYQDVNNIQYLLIKQFGNNITVVGDDYQAIYAFRGSDPKYFIDFTENYTEAQTFKLEQNYRSANNIVALSQSIIDNNHKQIKKKCYSNIENKVKPKMVHFKNEFQETKAIVTSCKKYLDDGFDLNEIAILYRTKMSSRVIEQEFNRNSIPYKIVNDISFFERREIKDVMAYVLFLYNYNDRISFKRMVQNPRKGIGDKTIQNIFDTPGKTLLEKIDISLKTNHSKAYKNLQTIMNMFEKAHSLPFKELIEYFITEIKYYDHLRNFSDDYELDERTMNVKELIHMSQQYESLTDFLDDCALINVDDHADDTQQITLMTIHAAKGLEFKVVFVIGLEEGTLPFYKAISEAEHSSGTDPISEERRLFYVACTRASRVLNISRCINRGWQKDMKISRFVTEIDSDLYNNLSILKS